MAITPIHPFNSDQKIFTDENSISLMLRLINVFNQPDMKYVYADPNGWEPPIGVTDQNNHKLSYILSIVPDDELDQLVNKLDKNPDVVAIFYHKGLDLKIEEGRMVYALMKDEASALRLAGM